MGLLRTDALTIHIAGKRVCDKLELHIEDGQIWALLGCNGVGKTTLLNTLAGLREPQAGTIELQGIPITSMSMRQRARRMGMLFQTVHDAFPATVLETALLGRHPYMSWWNWRTQEDIGLAEQALARFDLRDLDQRNILTLSGGERRRLALATLFTQSPPLALLDEPVDQLDPHHQISALNAIGKQYTHKGRACIMSLHDINLALRYCSHALLLYGEGQYCLGKIHEVITEQSLGALYHHPMQIIAHDRTKWVMPS